MADRRIW